MTITEFLLARIAEDEEQISAAVEMYEAWCWRDPASARRECEAKRRIIERFGTDYPHPLEDCDNSCLDDPGDHWARVGGAQTISDLASIYADHPDYDPTWATN